MILKEYSSRPSEMTSRVSVQEQQPGTESVKEERKERVGKIVRELEKSVRKREVVESIESQCESSDFSFNTMEQGEKANGIFNIPSSKVSNKKVN